MSKLNYSFQVELTISDDPTSRTIGKAQVVETSAGNKQVDLVIGEIKLRFPLKVARDLAKDHWVDSGL